jgi:Tfp pilus assembly protein PilN
MSLRGTSFVEPPRIRPRILAALVWTLAALALAALALSAWEARRLERVSAGLRDAADGLRHEIAGAQGAADRPSAAAFAELGARIERLNALAGPRRTPLPRLLEALEEALPEGVRIAQLTYEADTGAFAVSLLSEDEGALPEALQGIEGIELLGSVILERQVRMRQGGRNVVQYDVRGEAL